MAEDDLMENLDNLLVQLVLQTRELSSKRNDAQEHIQERQANIQQKKTYIEETKKSIEKLEEQIAEKQKTVQHYRENTKSMKRTHDLMMHYEKVLESELERRHENCNRDMKMYQDRIESYKAVLKKHKEKYHQHPLAQKLLKIQAKNEEIERTIRACEDQIAAGEKKRQALHDAALNKSPLEQGEESVSPGQIELQIMEQGDPSVEMKDQLSQSSGWDALDEGQLWGEERMEEAGAGIIADGSRSRAVQREVADKPMQGQREQEPSFSVFAMAEGGDEGFAGMAVESRGQDTPTPFTPTTPTPSTPSAAAGADASGVGAAGDSTPTPHTPPSRMKAAMSTPTFTLGSPAGSLGHSDSSSEKSPAFVFTMPAEPEPSTSGFSGFGFDMGSAAQEEENPFSFTSKYFSDEKFPDEKFSGFPFDQPESRSEEDFQFSFSAKSPTQNPTNEDKAGTSDGFPFSFNFGKF